MLTRFHKMHGLGNDFVVFDAREADVGMTEARARALSDRQTGIGCDQLIVLRASEQADAEMIIYNRDGGEVEACGNATRCAAQLIGGAPTITTKGGLLSAATVDGAITVTLEPPRFDWRDIPIAEAMDTRAMPVGWDELERPAAVNVGNPHLVFFVEDCDAIQLEQLGPRIENDPLFPTASTSTSPRSNPTASASAYGSAVPASRALAGPEPAPPPSPRFARG